jgi:hypothetical protein
LDTDNVEIEKDLIDEIEKNNFENYCKNLEAIEKN